jgi:SAM-dependent methyltransferase
MDVGLEAIFRALKRKLGDYYWDKYEKYSFLRLCPQNVRLLDVGCGNDSPRNVKASRPDIYYVGIDVDEYNQSDASRMAADQYIIVPSQEFAPRIRSMRGEFDVVISNHNLEHCDDPATCLAAMLEALRPGGRIFLAFPCEQSVGFPSRAGTLNFFDDPTHKTVPKFDSVRSVIAAHGLRLDVVCRRYRPLSRVIQGLKAELRSRRERRVLPGTWALYGFETIIWASKDTPDTSASADGAALGCETQGLHGSRGAAPDSGV